VRSPGRVDLRGAVLLGIGLVLPLVAVSQAHVWHWASLRTLGLIAAGVAVLAAWVVVQRRTEQPLADIATLTKPPVLITNLATLLVGFGMFGSFILIPQLAEAPTSTPYGLGYGATGAGLLMLPGSLLMLVLGPLSGIIGSRVGNKVPLALGAGVAAIGLLLLGVAHGSAAEILAFSALMFAGVGLAFAAMPNLIMEAVPPEQTGEATGFNALVRSVGASVGTQVSATILAGTVVASTGFPADSGYRDAFVISAAIAGVAAVAALLIPRAAHHAHARPLDEVGAASPLGEPALAGGSSREGRAAAAD
jgi:MFS family permease